MSSDFGFDVSDFSVGLLWHGPKHVFRLTMWLMQKIQRAFALTRPSPFALMSSRDFKHNNRKLLTSHAYLRSSWTKDSFSNHSRWIYRKVPRDNMLLNIKTSDFSAYICP